MSVASFDLFVNRISSMPANAILNSMDLEARLLDEDLDRYRSSFTGDEFSILYFRQFLHIAMSGRVMHCIRCFPRSHVDFYKRTIARLVQAGELASSVMDRFDDAFVVSRYN